MVTCEHAGNHIPSAYAHLFEGRKAILDSHRGYDIGAFEIANRFSEQLNAPLFHTSTSRLLVDCNRSMSNPELFSEFTRTLNKQEKKDILEDHYLPYRKDVESHIWSLVRNHPVLHLSIHSFTPVWKGEERSVDIGILFDDQRSMEQKFSLSWLKTMRSQLPWLNIEENEPYKGSDDGLTTHLRNRFSDEQYLGIELEVNQKWMASERLDELVESMLLTLRDSIDVTFGRHGWDEGDIDAAEAEAPEDY